MENSLRSLSKKQPFWGAGKVRDVLFKEQMDAISKKPPGSVVQIPPRLSVRHTRRVLDRMGQKSVRAAKKPLLTAIHKKRRVAFAKQYQQRSFDRVIFSDEKVFRVRPEGKVRCWVSKNDSKFLAKYTIPTVQKAESVMVWAATKAEGSICLRRCSRRMNAKGTKELEISARWSPVLPRTQYNIMALRNTTS
eukprot:EG_transcript_27605